MANKGSVEPSKLPPIDMQITENAPEPGQILNMNLSNICLFATKASIGIQKENQTDPFFQEVNDFVLCERSLKPIGLTCYLSSALLALNACRRFVIWYMIKEPFPFAENSFSNELRKFFTEFRMLTNGSHSYKGIL